MRNIHFALISLFFHIYGLYSTCMPYQNHFTDKWSPALQIRTVLLSIQALLSAPNPDDPLATDVAEQWKNNESDAIRTAQEWTRVHANGQ